MSTDEAYFINIFCSISSWEFGYDIEPQMMGYKCLEEPIPTSPLWWNSIMVSLDMWQSQRDATAHMRILDDMWRSTSRFLLECTSGYEIQLPDGIKWNDMESTKLICCFLGRHDAFWVGEESWEKCPAEELSTTVTDVTLFSFIVHWSWSTGYIGRPLGAPHIRIYQQLTRLPTDRTILIFVRIIA